MTGRLNEVYPKIGQNATTPDRVDFQKINTSALTVPTATKATVTGAITGAGFLAIKINDNDYNLMIVLD